MFQQRMQHQIYQEIHETENQLKDPESNQPNPEHSTHCNTKLSCLKNRQWEEQLSQVWGKK